MNPNTKFNAAPQLERKRLLANVASGSSNLMFFSILTLVNVILVLAKSTVTFAFSAMIPEFFIIFAQTAMKENGTNGVFVLFLAMALIFLALCFLCAYLSKKIPGWLIAGTVLVTLDTVFACIVSFRFLSKDDSISGLLTVLFHVWMLYYLIRALIALYKLKKLPPEPQTYNVAFEEVPTPEVSHENDSLGDKGEE